MSRLQVQFSSCMSMTVLLGLILTLSALGQDPAEPQPQSGSKTADKADLKSKADAEDGTKADARPKVNEDTDALTKTDRDWQRVTDQEWQRMLTRNQYLVTRRKQTEQPFSGKYATSHAAGTFLCVCCKAELFSSRHKFDSGTGWPSFWQPLDVRAIAQAPDYSEADPRMEVMCRRCGAHLGHVFDDGPDPTGLRFCINSLSLDFKAAAVTNPSSKTKTKAKAKFKSQSKTTKAKVNARKTPPKDGDASADSDRGTENGQSESATSPR